MSSALFLSFSHLPNTPQFPSNSNSLSNSSFRILNPHRIHCFKPPPISTTTTTTTTTDHPDQSISSAPLSRTDGAIKMPTAPWMKGPLLLKPAEVLDLSKATPKKVAGGTGDEKPDRSLTEKVSGGRGRIAMKKIIQGIVKLQETQNSDETQENSEEFEFGFSLEGIGGDENSRTGRKIPWLKAERVVFRRVKKENEVTAAELTLDPMLLERLRGEAVKMRKWVKVKKAGVSQGVVDQIHMVWKNNELAMVKFDMPLCRNMDRAREIVEIKTKGLVVWSKKNALVVYRGPNYQLNPKPFRKMRPGLIAGADASNSKLTQANSEDLSISAMKFHEIATVEKLSRKDGEIDSSPAGIFMQEMVDSQPVNGSLYEREADRLLEGLGPRFIDWWRPKPLPVDADLLPEIVPGYRLPFRLCPPHTRSKLTDDELRYLRKLAYALPTHFVLGRNRKLQGLAGAILKLWEKSLIVKIAIKWGIPNTNNEQMANELKSLTGGVLLLRNKFFIILYRGKDFLPCGVGNLIAEREIEFKGCQIHEEDARLKAIETFFVTDEPLANTSTVGTLAEFQNIVTKFRDLKDENTDIDVELEAEKERLEKELKNQERKLFILKIKIERSVKMLAKLNSAWRPADHDADKEIITEEERECFRKIGQKMESSLLLGRRGIFDGVIEGLHQHWKHREIVKVITMQRSFSKVFYTAKLLESESGGVLVSIDKLKEGHAIIIYRGKNYRRPLKLVPKNLLTKREALDRSLEMQRIGSLKFFAYQRQQAISDLKFKLADLQKGSRLHIRDSRQSQI